MSLKFTAIYLRVSSRERALEGYGLEAQREKCDKWIDLYNIDSKNVRYYVDDGYSAKNLKRPKMQELLKDIRSGKVGKIITYKLDRLTRNVVDTYNLIKELDLHQCELAAIIDNLDITSANGRLFVGILSIIAQWEREVISERTIDGMVAMAQLGKYPFGSTPFGWCKDEFGRLHIDPTDSKIVLYAAERILEGHSLTYISSLVKREFGIYKSALTIKKELSNERLIGKFRYRENDYIGLIPAIMEEDKFMDLQKVLAFRQIHAPRHRKYIFHSTVYCKNCGCRMEQSCTTKGTTIYYYYCCPHCKARINQDKLLKSVLDPICDNMQSLREERLYREYEKKMIDLNTSIENVMMQYQNRELSQQAFALAMESLSDQMANLKKGWSIASLSKDTFHKADPLLKFQFVQSTVAKIVFDPFTKKHHQVEFKRVL